MSLIAPSPWPMILEAKEVIRRKLSARDPLLADEFLRRCELPVERFDAGKRFMERLRKELQVDSYLMRPDERMAELFCVARKELPIETAPAWEANGFRTYIEPFAYDLMWAMEKSTDKKKSVAMWKSMERPPRSEDQWIDLFMSMTVGSFVKFVVDMMK